jgi:hypothetical protein
MKVNMRQKDFYLIKPLIDLIQSKLDKDLFYFGKYLGKTYEFKRGGKCVICKEIIPQKSSQFYCPFTKEYLCFSCGNTNYKK